ncbi:hypothetical protein BDZ45DRAFT_107445 [Acephala macrosclerotiorum]|nr:hypothetical protein BDZ45DRAFT_107445 [Acephala macrosclerotiorum]
MTVDMIEDSLAEINPTSSPERPESGTRAALALEIFDKWCQERVNAIHNNPPFPLPPGVYMHPDCRWQVAHLYAVELVLNTQEWKDLSMQTLFKRVPLLKEWRYRDKDTGLLIQRLQQMVEDVRIAWPKRQKEAEATKRKAEEIKKAEEEQLINNLSERIRVIKGSVNRGGPWDELFQELRLLVDDVEVEWIKCQKREEAASQRASEPREAAEEPKVDAQGEERDLKRISKAELMQRKMKQFNLPITDVS